MPERPWHRIGCSCPECQDPPGEPTRGQLLALVVLLLAAAGMLWLSK